MYLIRLISVITQIHLCCSLLHFCGIKKDKHLPKKTTNILNTQNNPGWSELREILDNTSEKDIINQIFYDLNENDRKFNAANVLSELYGTLQIEIYQFYHCISFECIEKKIHNVEFILTEFKKLAKMINMFEPLLQCMTKALDYLDSQSDVHNLLHDSINKYKEIDEFLLDENLQKLKKESSRYELDVLNKLKEFTKYHYDIVFDKDPINNFDYAPFVEKYINQFKNLSNHEKKYYPDPYHVDMKSKVKEGVQMFCKDFGFDFEQEIGNKKKK